MTDHAATQDLALVEKLRTGYTSITEQLSHIIVGQQAVIEQMLTALFCRGHVLVVGVPGTAKTLLVSSIARILDLSFQRIQFTPDLMPSDITGTDVMEQDPATGSRSFRFIRGPVFGQIILADEINRTPPKTQAALLQAMQEYTVTAGGQTYSLPLPFFVLATQNPIEQEGTYPLPEAQLDRFFFQINVNYPSEQEEKQVVLQTTGDYQPALQQVLNAADIQALQHIVRRVPAAEHTVDYAVRLARGTRPQNEASADFVRQYVRWGAGPRGAQALMLAAKARALMQGRAAVAREDITAVALPCLRHRVLVNFHAEAEGITSEKIITRLIEQYASA